MTDSTSALADLAQLKREVQVRLGRCVWRLQQYEMLMKEMLSLREVDGTIDQFRHRLATRDQVFLSTSLGQLVGIFVEHFLTIEGAPEPRAPDARPASDAPVFRMRRSISMDAVSHARSKAELRAFVELRNRLVHHFVERFDLGSTDGCKAAVGFLDESFASIETRLRELSAMADSMNQATLAHAEFLRSPEGVRWVVTGFTPENDAALAQAMQRALAPHGDADRWVPLQAVVDCIVEADASSAPGRFGCASWSEVFNDSRRFDVRRRPGGGGRVHWVRLRDDSQAPRQ